MRNLRFCSFKKGLKENLFSVKISAILISILLSVPYITTKAENISIKLTNTLNSDRTKEVVEVPLSTISDFTTLALFDESGNKIAYQVLQESRIAFQANVKANSNTTYTLRTQNPISATSYTYAAKKLPSSRNDIAWENDLCAYRMYSSVLLSSEPNTANGVDMWSKKMATPIIDKLYNYSNYHSEQTEGVDAYSVNGKTLGVGGIVAYSNNKLWIHNPYDECKILTNGPFRSEFILTYNNVEVDGDFYKKTVRITTNANGLLNKAIVKFEGKAKAMKIASGIYLHNNMSGVTPNGIQYTSEDNIIGYAENKSEGTVTSANARFFEGVIMPGTTTTSVISNHLVIMSDYTVGEDFVYYFGGGWNIFPAGKYLTDNDWFKALSQHKQEITNPIQVDESGIVLPPAETIKAVPYLPQLDNFNGNSVDMDSFIPSTENYTLEVQGIAGTEISIAGSAYSYTPTTTGTIRFAYKNGNIFVYEGSVYKKMLIPSNQVVYPDIFAELDNSSSKTGIYDSRNLLKNPGFEEWESYFSGYDPTSSPTNVRGIPKDWTSVFLATNNRVNNISTNPDYTAIRSLAEGNNTFMLHGYDNTADGMRIYQKVEGLLPNTHYKVKYRHFAHKDTNTGTYTAAIGNLTTNLKEYTYSAPPIGLGNYTDVELIFTTPETITENLYFSVTRGTKSIGHLDRMTIVEGFVPNTDKGISGATNATYLTGVAYAPEYTLASDEIFDLTDSYIANARVTDGKGWMNATTNSGEEFNGAPDNVYLDGFSGSAFSIDFYQSIENIPNGYYKLVAAIRSNTNAFSIYAKSDKEYRKTIAATGNSGNILGNGWQDFNIAPIYVGTNKMQIGLSGGAPANTWVSADNFRLYYYPTKAPSPDSVYLNVNKDDVIQIIEGVNDTWQQKTYKNRAFWDNAAYHTGNMEAYAITGKEAYRQYSTDWSAYNSWKGATSNDKSAWKYGYGETMEYVLFGDWQICFQTYIDLYNLEGKTDPTKIARAREVMEYQMSTANKDYWWWADGLYMVMPVMVKLYKETNNELYLDKLYEYFNYADNLMYDSAEGLYYRDGNYVYPKEPTINGRKNFWARGAGWVFAGLAKVLQDLPETNSHRDLYISRFQSMAAAVKASQQPNGYWTRSMLDYEHAPSFETSGTAFFTYGLLWGINNGFLNESEYKETAVKGWNYLQNVALQPDKTVGYIQPIGSAAIPSQVVRTTDYHNFGVGAFLLAASELYRTLDKEDDGSDINNDIIRPSSISFYPNPVSANLTIDNITPNTNIELFNAYGQIIRRFVTSTQRATIDMSIYPQGMYYIKAGNKTGKIIKK